MSSFLDQHPGHEVFVLTSGGVELPGLDMKLLPAAPYGLADGFPLADIFTHEEQVMFATPHAALEVLEYHEAIAYIQPGCLVVSPLQELAQLLDTSPFVLAAPRLVHDNSSATPHLAQVSERNQLLSHRLVGLSRSAGLHLDFWRGAMRESVVDAFLRRPHNVYPGLLETLLATKGGSIAKQSTMARLADYAAIELGLADGPQVSIVTCDEIWATGREAFGEDADEATVARQVGDMYLSARIHDARPISPLIEYVHRGMESAPIEHVDSTPFDVWKREVRRASDPRGLRWPAGSWESFNDWLFEKSPYGLTRAAHLYWLEREGLQETFADAQLDPEGYREWFRTNGVRQFGMDLFDPNHVPDEPKTLEEPEEMPSRTSLEALSNAVLWRTNVLRSLMPGHAARQARKLDRLSEETRVVLEAPRRVEVVRTDPLFGDSPRKLTLAGLLRSNSGLGQAARASLGALQMLGREFSYFDTTDQYLSRNTADPGLAVLPQGAFGDVNLIHANAAEFVGPLPIFRHRLGGRYNIAMWFWEGATVPDAWHRAFDRIDELWVASEYLGDVFGQYGKIPVHVIGLAAELPQRSGATRDDLSLDNDEFIFLFVYDALSVPYRKNPEKALQAFVNAFAPKFENVRFILKAHNLHKFPDSEARIRELGARYSAITVIEDYLSRADLLDLMALSDVYVSLHAAEGYGLTLLEAMALGTPCITTGFSGNMDFTSDENSWLVDYTLTSLDEAAGPYPAGTVWALPNVETAVDMMRAAYENRSTVAAKSIRAIRDAEEVASLELYADRLDEQLSRVLD